MTLKKFVSLLCVLAICFSLASCSGTKKLKLGKTSTVKYSASSSTVCSFTAREKDEYTFRHESDACARCTVYADPELTQPVGHPCEGSSFAFSLALDQGETVYLELEHGSSGDARAAVTVSRYSDDRQTTVNYGHPAEMTLGSAKSLDNNAPGVPRVFCFESAGSGTFVFQCLGTDSVEVRFYDGPWCANEIGDINNTSYPSEKYRSSGSLAFCTARNMSKGETVYFTVTPLTENCSDEISVCASTAVPDPASAAEKFLQLTSAGGYPSSVLVSSEPSGDFAAGFGCRNIGCFASPVAYYDSAAGSVSDGSDIGRYITSQELGILSEGSFAIYSTDEVQKSIDSLWGPGRLQASRFQDNYAAAYGGGWSLLATVNGYIFALQGLGDDGAETYYKVISSSSTAKAAVVTVIGLRYDSFEGVVSDAASFLGFDGKVKDVPCAASSSLEEYLVRMNVGEGSLSPLDFVFYSTADGIRLWGVYPSGTYTLPAIPNAACHLPEVIPPSFDPETKVTVTGDTGLRLRSGPSQDYGTVLIIPYKTVLRCYGESDGWFYVCYEGRYGWVSGEYIEQEHIQENS